MPWRYRETLNIFHRPTSKLQSDAENLPVNLFWIGWMFFPSQISWERRSAHSQSAQRWSEATHAKVTTDILHLIKVSLNYDSSDFITIRNFHLIMIAHNPRNSQNFCLEMMSRQLGRAKRGENLACLSFNNYFHLIKVSLNYDSCWPLRPLSLNYDTSIKWRKSVRLCRPSSSYHVVAANISSPIRLGAPSVACSQYFCVWNAVTPV